MFRFDFTAAGFVALDEILSGALVCLFFEFLLDFFADDGPAFEAARLADAFDPSLVFRAGGLPDFLVDFLRVFLRVFLDIRLPFVAFRGSIIEVLRQAGPVGLALSDYAQKEFDAPPARWRGYSRMTSETPLVPLQN